MYTNMYTCIRMYVWSRQHYISKSWRVVSEGQVDNNTQEVQAIDGREFASTAKTLHFIFHPAPPSPLWGIAILGTRLCGKHDYHITCYTSASAHLAGNLRVIPTFQIQRDASPPQAAL